MTDLYVKTVPQRDPRLGRQVVHDPRSRGFAAQRPIDESTWHNKAVRLYDPQPKPNQVIGNCTGCAKAMQLNAVGNRRTGVVLKMADADRLYSWASNNDPWSGAWPPTDTGSSGLASAQAAQHYDLGGEYTWDFRGWRGVVQNVINGNAVSVGTRWTYGMFNPNADGVIEPIGGDAGGHQWIVRRVKFTDAHAYLGVDCWWGGWSAWIRDDHAGELLADDGDAHVQARA